MDRRNLANGGSYFIFSFFICGECVLVSVSSALISLPIQAAGQVFQNILNLLNWDSSILYFSCFIFILNSFIFFALLQVASFRGSISSFQEQASSSRPKVSSVAVPVSLCQPFNLKMSLSGPLKVNSWLGEDC